MGARATCSTSSSPARCAAFNSSSRICFDSPGGDEKKAVYALEIAVDLLAVDYLFYAVYCRVWLLASSRAPSSP